MDKITEYPAVTQDFINTDLFDVSKHVTQTSGALISGKEYTILTYVAGDDFSNIATVVSGTINTTGCVFTATGTTPTDYTNGSTIARYVSQKGTYEQLIDAFGLNGTTNFLVKFTGSDSVEDSIIKDDGTYVGIGTITSDAKLEVAVATTSTGANIFKVSFPLADIFTIDDNYNVNFVTNNGVNIKGSNGALTLVSNGGTSPSIAFKYNNGSNTSGVIYGSSASMGIETPLLGVGNTTFTATSNLHLKGTNGYNQLRLDTSYTPSSTADLNGAIGDISWDDSYFYVKTSAGWKRSALSTF